MSDFRLSYTLTANLGTVNYSISGIPNWLTPTSTSGTASTGTTVTFTVNAQANGLGVGTNTATITFANSDPGQGTQNRTATLPVNPPGLQVTPAGGIAATGTHGGPFSPSSFRYMLSATYGSVKYSITTPSWLTASSASGTVTTSAHAVTFTVNSWRRCYAGDGHCQKKHTCRCVHCPARPSRGDARGGYDTDWPAEPSRPFKSRACRPQAAWRSCRSSSCAPRSGLCFPRRCVHPNISARRADT